MGGAVVVSGPGEVWGTAVGGSLVEVLSDTDELFYCMARGVGCDGAGGDCSPGHRRAWRRLQLVEARMVVVRRRGCCCVREWVVVDAGTVDSPRVAVC